MQQQNRAAQEGLRTQRAYEPGAVPGPSGSCGLRLFKRRCLGRLRLRAVLCPLVAVPTGPRSTSADRLWPPIFQLLWTCLARSSSEEADNTTGARCFEGGRPRSRPESPCAGPSLYNASRLAEIGRFPQDDARVAQPISDSIQGLQSSGVFASNG